MNLQQVADKFLDIGETHYLVDSDYRTQAQGWSRADRTGPLDIYLARNGNSSGGYVFRTGDFATDAACWQAAIDQAVDFRGDVILATPGAYSLGTIVNFDVSDLRLLGPRAFRREQARVTVTDTVGSHVIAAAADRMEIGWMKFVPLTATRIFLPATGCDNLIMHDFVFDQRGVAASTSTGLLLGTGTFKGHIFRDFTSYSDQAGGPVLAYTVAHNLSIRNFMLWHGHLTTGATMAVALLFVSGASLGIEIEGGRGNLSGLASNAVTNLVSAFESGGDVANVSCRDIRHSIGFCAASGLVNLASSAEVGEIGLAAAYLDVVSAGAGGAGTAFTA